MLTSLRKICRVQLLHYSAILTYSTNSIITELQMKDKEIDILYKPFHWSNRKDVLKYHFDFIAKESKRSRELIPSELNIPYGQRERQKIDIYGTDLPDSAPIFIFYHGGYWQQLCKEDSSFAAQSFYKHNIKTIVIGYSLCPEVTMYEMVKEIEQATSKCIEYAKKSGSRSIYMAGYSAGCHLIACLFANLFPSLSTEDHSLFKAAILCGGLYDITPVVLTNMNRKIQLTHNDALNLSPMFKNIPPLNFPVYVVISEYDSPAFKEQSKLYFNKIKPVCDVKFKIMQGCDHFNIVERMIHEDYELVKLVSDIDKKITK
ncbi:Kynurenine formamidase [Carabus blaptoides fortunei]